MGKIMKCTICGKEFEFKGGRDVICSNCKHKRGKANTKRRDEFYDQIQLYVPKESEKNKSAYHYSRQDIKDFAKSHGISTNEFINKTIKYYIEHFEEISKEKNDLE